MHYLGSVLHAGVAHHADQLLAVPGLQSSVTVLHDQVYCPSEHFAVHAHLLKAKVNKKDRKYKKERKRNFLKYDEKN